MTPRCLRTEALLPCLCLIWRTEPVGQTNETVFPNLPEASGDEGCRHSTNLKAWKSDTLLR